MQISLLVNYPLITGMLTQEGYFIATGKTTVDDIEEPMVVWGARTLVAKFQELMKHKIYYSRIGLLKNDRAEEMEAVSRVDKRKLKKKRHSRQL